MKKLFALMLTLLLLLSCFPAALAQDEMLTVDEMLTFCDQVLSDALQRTPVSAEPAEEGGYMFEFSEYTIYSLDAQLTQNTRITGVALNNPFSLMADMRGVFLTDTLADLLNAYPLDNPNLQGAYDEAVLYINGLLPGTVNTGRVLRDGSHVLIAEHTVYTMDGEQAEKCCVVYTLENNFVIAVQIMLDVQRLSLEEAHAELSALSSLQEVTEYSVYAAEEPEAFTREDLTFGQMDFLTVTPESALSLLGSATSDTWVQDGSGYMRSMQWSDAQLVFSYDAQRQNSRLLLLEVYGAGMEGPRNLHLGDSVESVVNRFMHDDDYTDGVLYGQEGTAPYGLFEQRPDGEFILYAAPVEDQTVLLALTFVEELLADISCTYL